MSRELDAGLEGAIEAPVVRPALAIFIDLPDPVWAWTGVGTITFPDANGIDREWTGAGGVGAVDTVTESTDGSATGIKVSLFNVPSEFRSDIADQAVRGEAFELYIIAVNETYQQVEGSKLLWRGRVDTYDIIDAGETITVEVTGESRMRDQGRPSIKRFTNEWQNRKFPGDRFFEFVPQMVEIPIMWAKQTDAIGGTGGGAASVGGGSHATNWQVR